jgi:hypothetical protein
MTRFRTGTIQQSGLTHQPGDYGHESISHPVLGIVLNVFCSDEIQNTSSQRRQDGRGSQCEARVLVVNDGTDSPWILPNVVVTPPGSTGFDNFDEDIPKGVTGLVDDSSVQNINFEDIPLHKLDGDWCIVDFIGGSIHQPFIVTWWPHPANRRDPTTSNVQNIDALPQGRRRATRFQGTRFTVTSKGSVIVDTTQANHLLDAGQRVENEEGGDLYVTIKKGRVVDINFNPFDQEVDGDGVPLEPDFLWPPDAKQIAEGAREELVTRLLMDQDFIKAIAGKVVEIAGSENLYLGREGQADENFVLGQQWKTLMSDMLTQLINHTHPTGVGPSGPSAELASDFPTKKTSVDNEDQLSDWILGQKVAPTP